MGIGIPAIHYALPTSKVTLEELARSQRLETSAERLREFGFGVARVSDKPAEVLAQEALCGLLATTGKSPETIGALFHAGAIPSSHRVSGPHQHVIEGFRYPAARLQYECGLLNAITVGVGQLGCVGLMAAIKLAADFLRVTPDAQAAMCVSADVLPLDAPREFIYNVVSDGACALLVERAERNRILSYRQITKGYYWDAASLKNEIVAAYFPTAQHLVRATIADAGLTARDIDWVLPHNVSVRSWEILMRLLEIPRDRVFLENVADKGHVIAADNFINLKDATDAGLVRRGQRLLLFTFGFGATWACMVLEH
jgi:3-oxoacyl-[acyl-carrier-protein] synthase III